jgi:hypothetical protein
LILVHAIDHEALNLAFHRKGEVIKRVRLRALDNFGVELGGDHELIEEELVCLSELGAEAVVQNIDDLGQRGAGLDQPKVA